MTIDIKEGDILTVGSASYTIKFVGEWSNTHGYTKGMSHMTTLTGSTKRNPAVSGGKRGVPVTKVATLACTPLWPVGNDVVQRLGLETPLELKQAFVGDSSMYYELILEELRD